MLGKLLVFGLAVGIGFLGYKINKCLFHIPPIPDLKDEWWGPGAPAKEDTSIKPFKIQVSDETLKDLRYRLDNARPFTPPLEGIQQQYGMNTNLLKEIVDFWRTKYNWREREQFLNKYNQFVTNVQGLKIHFLHVKPKATSGVKTVPLLLLHGWPGSVREFYELIPLLTTPQKGRDFVFEVIAPSLPGYGFSQGAAKPGLGDAQMAVVFNNLMKRIGFDRYYVQGGDWGAVISSHMGVLFPKNVLGVHSTMCIVNTPLARIKLLLGSLYPSLIVDKEFQHKLYPIGDLFSFVMLEFGYMHLQATKPDTVGVGLNDSPVGLAAYILEKFTTWTNKEWKERADGGLTLKYSYTDLLDNVMIYWVTNSITTSARLYSETFNKAQLALNINNIPVIVPSACTMFKHELGYTPEIIVREKYTNLVQLTHHDDGGHFAAFEVPERLAKDIWSAVDAFRKHDKN